MSNITEKIDSIIETRQSKLPAIRKAIENLTKCTDAISEIELVKADLNSDDSKFSGLFGTPETIAKVQSIYLENFNNLAKSYRYKLEQLEKRFSRNQLQISLVGRARQGKSLVIQNISGLDKSIIPSSDGSDCTGAKSIITNSEINDVIAEITFYNEREMMDIINNYLEKITGNTSYNINSFNAIKNIPIDILKKEVGLKPTECEYIEHLQNYIRHIDELKDHLGKTITVPKEDIEKYVAQFKHGDPNTKYWNFLGVKTADIKCSFPFSDAGKIVLLDTIGIGTTSLGVEASMLDTVENDSDAIIFMFRPDPLGPKVSNNEIYAIKIISERVGEDYAKEMLFWVINRVEEGKGRNVDHISIIRNQILDGFPISEILEVNCLSKESVEEKLLLPVLNKMSNRINAVDALLVNKVNSVGIEVYNEFKRIVNTFECIQAASTNVNIRKAFREKIVNMYQVKILNSLRELYINKYGKRRNEPCTELSEAAEETLSKMFSFVPEEEQLIELLNNGTVKQANAMMITTDLIRLEIIDAFTELDDILSKIVKNMKYEVVKLFADKEYGCLESIESDYSDPEDWIKRFIDKINVDGNYPEIEAALTEFANFKCSVQGFLIFEVRNNLDVIDSELRTLPTLVTGIDNKPKLAREIHEKLLNEIEKVHNQLEITLNKLYAIPNRAMFAAIKDLYDRCSFESKESSDSKRKLVAIDHIIREWEELYGNNIASIWQDEWREKMSSQMMAEEFNAIVDIIKECSCKEFYNIEV